PSRQVTAFSEIPFREKERPERNAGLRQHNYTVLAALAICTSASTIGAVSVGRTRRATSLPDWRKINVGQSFTRYERPSGRPEPSSILMCGTDGKRSKAAAMCGNARWQ